MRNTNKETIYVIKPPKGLVNIDFQEIWRFRELLYIFAWRDLKVRYKQTILGIAWAIFQPLLTMVIFTVFFGNLAKIPSDGVPYPVFVYTGLLFWNYFSTALTNASNCLIDNEAIVKKVYFPRLILPLAVTITPIVDFAFAFVVLLVLMLVFGYMPNILGLLLVPVFLLISFVTASGLGMFLSAINAKYRDVRYILPFFIQLLMFVTPVIYPVSIIPRFKWVAYFNPMSGVISSARSALLNGNIGEWQGLLMALVMAVFLFIFGLFVFRKTERFFADIL